MLVLLHADMKIFPFYALLSCCSNKDMDGFEEIHRLLYNCTAATSYSLYPKEKLVAAQQFSMNLPKGPKYP